MGIARAAHLTFKNRRFVHLTKCIGIMRKPRLAAEKTGSVLTAPCSCMAGLGETRTHAVMLMFAGSVTTHHFNATLVA